MADGWSVQRLRRGVESEPPARIALTAGRVHATLDGIDLRDVSVGAAPLIDRVYAALRDKDWNTVPATISGLAIERSDGGFSVSFDAHHVAHDIDYTWHGTIEGDAEGEIRYRMRGTAGSRFLYCRIGFCVLHPDSLAGAEFVAHTPDGPVTGTLPRLVGPQDIVDGIEIAVVPACTSLQVAGPGGERIETDFRGDLFETEDQRNWTDASFKTYCTPAALGYPFEAEPGQLFDQSVTIRIAGGEREPVATTVAQAALRIGGGTGRTLPALGLGFAHDEGELSAEEVARLRRLRLGHLRVDVRPSVPGWEATLGEAARQATGLACPLEVALFVPSGTGDPGADPSMAAEATRAVAAQLADVDVVRWLVFDEATAGTGSTPAGLVPTVRKILVPTHPAADLVAGTDGDFAELNRDRPDLHGVDGVAYGVNPQVHASDDRSLMENSTAQGFTVETARSFAGARSVHVSPVTLAPRFNPVATGPEAPTAPGELPSSVDHRQVSLLGAAWTVGSIRSLSAAAATSVTYYETVGWRGLMERAGGSRVPERFLSEPGLVFPMYHVFAALASMIDSELLDAETTAPRALAGLFTRERGEVRGLMANLTGEELPVSVGPFANEVHLRLLDETTAELAMADATAYWLAPTAPAKVVDGQLRLTLRPYSTVLLTSGRG